MLRPRENRRYGAALPGLLLVEGVNDLNFLSQLFVKRGLWDFDKKQSQFLPKGFASVEKGSYPELKSGLIEEFKDEGLDAIGIVVDADEDLAIRWQDLTRQLAVLGYSNLPDRPDPQGCIVDGQKRLGVWLMPDNQIAGILEHFIAWMVPDKSVNPLWQHVEQSIATLPGQPRFPAKDLAKAQLSTWLAWQEEPGLPISYAIRKQYVDAQSPSADAFIAWIKRLFQIS